MESARLSDSFHSEQHVGVEDENPNSDHLETIDLLQEEVARLERELQLRDDRQWETTSTGVTSRDDEADSAAALESGSAASEEAAQLTAELASREETIRLLLDELGRVEEVQAATRAEWEHLTGWVAELERRVEGQDGEVQRQLEDRLAAQKQKADAQRLLTERASDDDGRESSDAKLALALEDRQELGRQLEQLKDEMKRQQLEHDATVADLQARLANASLARPEGPLPEKVPEGISNERDIDLRIRALRHNLIEIDQHEKEERSQKRLVARLSRLWSRTGPR